MGLKLRVKLDMEHSAKLALDDLLSVHVLASTLVPYALLCCAYLASGASLALACLALLCGIYDPCYLHFCLKFALTSRQP